MTAELTETGTLTVTGADGSLRADGTASLTDEMTEPRTIDAADLPDPVPPAESDLLTAGTTLGTLRFHHRQEPAVHYLADIRETSDLYENGLIGHPGLLARQANYVLSNSVRLGPWIHVSTDAQHRGVVHDGDSVEVHGVVHDEREHKGHRFVDLDVEVITANQRPVWSARHTAIWRPRTLRRARSGTPRRSVTATRSSPSGSMPNEIGVPTSTSNVRCSTSSRPSARNARTVVSQRSAKT